MCCCYFSNDSFEVVDTILALVTVCKATMVCFTKGKVADLCVLQQEFQLKNKWDNRSRNLLCYSKRGQAYTCTSFSDFQIALFL